MRSTNLLGSVRGPFSLPTASTTVQRVKRRTILKQWGMDVLRVMYKRNTLVEAPRETSAEGVDHCCPRDPTSKLAEASHTPARVSVSPDRLHERMYLPSSFFFPLQSFRTHFSTPPPQPEGRHMSTAVFSPVDCMNFSGNDEARESGSVESSPGPSSLIDKSAAGSVESFPFHDRWALINAALRPLGKCSAPNVVEVFKDSSKAYEAMWKAIDEAKEEVMWQTYICKDDNIGRITVRKLVEARRRGCKVELLYDDGGNITGRSRLVDPLRQAGASVVLYRPILSVMWRYLLTLDWRISPGLRNHRKILLVDGKIGFVGGLNIGDDYCGKEAGGNGRFRDTHCSVQGPAVEHLRNVYEDTKVPQSSRFSFYRWRQRLRGTYPSPSRYSRRLLAAVREFRGPQWTPRTGKAVFMKRRGPIVQERVNRMLASSKWKRKKGVSFKEGKALSSRLEEAKAGLLKAPTAKEVLESTVAGGVSMLKRGRQLLFDVPLYRSATKALMLKPIADSEPVPESLYIPSIDVDTQILQSNPRTGDYSIQYALWQVLRKCHRRVWVTTPYFLPSGKHLKAMMYSAQRGVDVRLLTGGRRTTDPWFMWYASMYITELLLQSGVRVFEYAVEGEMMHAKTMVADSMWSCVGTFNWDPMSNKNLETCLFHLNKATAREMERHFLEDMSVSEEMTLEKVRSRPLLTRIVARLFYHFVFLCCHVAFRSYEAPDLVYSHEPPPSFAKKGGRK